jgi:triacylglycerol esterase/lipase EstA (alpha/beta hydrolase family)
MRTATGRRRLGVTRPLVALAAALSILGATASSASATTYPVIYSVLQYIPGAFSPNSPPAGANIASCQPSSAHPRPVVLVNGTFANQSDDMAAISPLLANHGYCVYTFNFGGPPLLGTAYGVGDIATSAGQLSSYVDQVLAQTHATKVDLVGHSQGGMMPRYYLKFLGGAAKVQNLVGLAPSSHGTTLDGLVTLAGRFGIAGVTNATVGALCQSCVQQEVGSSFLANLNAGGDTVPGVTYTVIESKYDEVVTPYTSAFLSGPNVKNITIQNQCPLDFDGHIGIAYDHIALQDMLNALDPAHASNPFCTFIAFDLGG